jgi:hypothetical protein
MDPRPFLKAKCTFNQAYPVVFQRMSFPDFAVYMYCKLKWHKYGGVYQFMIPVVLLRDPELIKKGDSVRF